jgi:signal transduction histidine kinase
MSMRLTAVDLNKVIKEVINYSQLKANDHRVMLSVDTVENLPLVQADEEKISWAILQLLDNAIKFTPSGGMVTLSVQPESSALVMVAVKDTGIGIPSTRLGELFEPFHQLDDSSTRRYGGTGLGLALVRDILHAHGSIIEVHSEEGKGSTFQFPLLAAAMAS